MCEFASASSWSATSHMTMRAAPAALPLSVPSSRAQLGPAGDERIGQSMRSHR
jgi:hypothetical protein